MTSEQREQVLEFVNQGFDNPEPNKDEDLQATSRRFANASQRMGVSVDEICQVVEEVVFARFGQRLSAPSNEVTRISQTASGAVEGPEAAEKSKVAVAKTTVANPGSRSFECAACDERLRSAVTAVPADGGKQ
jgi:hypothetical protein